MPLKSLVILAEGFEEIEAITPVDILRRAGIRVTTAGLEGLSVKGSRGVTIVADKVLGEDDQDFDAVILPGGTNGAENLASSQTVNQLLKTMNNNGKIVAAICASPALVLAPAGILDNKYATCYPGMEENFSNYTTFKEDRVVVDGNIITSRGPGTALEFALAIVEKMAGKDAGKKIRTATLASW
ncbi:MAG: DJ-1/PfpI family protein [Candidatus Aureabacteria bacterium]|nr:DJ-1/PfpI family protein [Candidatus Auribacterota bacterium]